MSSESDDFLNFAEEPESSGDAGESWRILIIDDDVDIHHVTRMAVGEMRFEGKPLVFISAYSAKEAKEILHKPEEIAVILLDVVMESRDSGLQLAHYIRKELNLEMPRIILRTGHPGYAPEEEVITTYDINDYRNKTDLTSRNLFLTLTTSLRAFRDLKKIDDAHRQLEETQGQLLQSAKLAAVGEMATALAHELGQPIHFVKLLNEMMIEDWQEGRRDDLLPDLEKIESQVHRMEEITKTMKGFGRDASTVDIQELDLLKSIKASLDLTQSILYLADIHVIQNLPDTPVMCVCNPIQIEQVFVNLINNAKDAMCDMEPVPVKQLSISVFALKTNWVIQIKDTGHGMSKELQEKAFKNFFTTKVRGKGTGLGLSISKGIIENHGGQLSVDSKEGEGATFRIELPFSSETESNL